MPVSYLSKKLSPYVRVAAIIVVAALMVFAGLRFYSWRSYGARSRLITLVNPWNPVSETGFSARLVEAENGMRVDRSCAESLQRMLADCRAAGRNPVLAGAYRSVDEQLVLHDERFQQLVDEGRSPEEAEAETSKVIAAAGRSEHELGLAVDIVDEGYRKPRKSPASAGTLGTIAMSGMGSQKASILWGSPWRSISPSFTATRPRWSTTAADNKPID